jgi:hypothetical protein
MLCIDQLYLTDNWEDYPNQSMGTTQIDGMNEKEEMEITDVSLILHTFPYYFFHIVQ